MLNLILPHLVDLAAILLSIVIGRAAIYAKDRWGMDIEAKHREALHSAIMSGVQAAVLSGRDGETAILSAVRYARSSTPGAIKALKAADSVLEDLAAAKLASVKR